MFGKIFVPVDGSPMAENYLPHLVSIARAFEAEVLLLYVPEPSTETPGDSWDWQIRQAEARAYLKELSSRLQEAGLQAQTNVLAGKFPDNLINHTSNQTTDLIMISSSYGLGGEKDFGLSSVVMNLVQRARTSVMIVRANLPPAGELADLRYRRILVPLDGSQRGEYGLSAAARLAHIHQAELLLAHVIKPPDMPRRTPLNKQDSLLMDQVVESNRAEAFEYLNRLKGSMGSGVETCLFVSDHVADSLHRLIEQENIDLIILNAHGLSGDPQWPYGSIASNFLANAAIPLLVVQDIAQDQYTQTEVKYFMREPAGYFRPVLNHARGMVREVER
jgi:nucleotide-binding universal stress UspA family protein